MTFWKVEVGRVESMWYNARAWVDRGWPVSMSKCLSRGRWEGEHPVVILHCCSVDSAGSR